MTMMHQAETVYEPYIKSAKNKTCSKCELPVNGYGVDPGGDYRGIVWCLLCWASWIDVNDGSINVIIPAIHVNLD